MQFRNRNKNENAGRSGRFNAAGKAGIALLLAMILAGQPLVTYVRQTVWAENLEEGSAQMTAEEASAPAEPAAQAEILAADPAAAGDTQDAQAQQPAAVTSGAAAVPGSMTGKDAAAAGTQAGNGKQTGENKQNNGSGQTDADRPSDADAGTQSVAEGTGEDAAAGSGENPDAAGADTSDAADVASGSGADAAGIDDAAEAVGTDAGSGADDQNIGEAGQADGIVPADAVGDGTEVTDPETQAGEDGAAGSMTADPDNTDPAAIEGEEADPEGEDDKDAGDEDEEEKKDEEKEKEKMPAAEFSGGANGVGIYVFAPEGAFPEGTTMVVSPAYVDAVVEAVLDNVQDVRAVDITFYNKAGAEIEPIIPVTVSMSAFGMDVPEEVKDTQAAVVHVDDGYNAAVVSGASTDGSSAGAVFAAGSFSIYALVVTGTPYDDNYMQEAARDTIKIRFEDEDGNTLRTEETTETLTEETSISIDEIKTKYSTITVGNAVYNCIGHSIYWDSYYDGRIDPDLIYGFSSAAESGHYESYLQMDGDGVSYEYNRIAVLTLTYRKDVLTITYSATLNGEDLEETIEYPKDESGIAHVTLPTFEEVFGSMPAGYNVQYWFHNGRKWESSEIQITESTTATAKIVGNPTRGSFTIIYKAGTGGSVTRGFDSAESTHTHGQNYEYEHLDKIAGAKAVPDDGYRFTGWTGGTISTPVDTDVLYWNTMKAYMNAESNTHYGPDGKVYKKTVFTANFEKIPDKDTITLSVDPEKTKYTYSGSEQSIPDDAYTGLPDGVTFPQQELAGIHLHGKGINAGEYQVNFTGDLPKTLTGTVAGGLKKTYKVIYQNGFMTIDPVSVTLRANSNEETIVYDGQEHPVTGFVCEDAEGAVLEGITFKDVTAGRTETDAGEYPVEFSPKDPTGMKDDSGNYVVGEVITGTLTIDHAPATVTPDDKEKFYGDADPALTAAEEGLIDGDTLSYELSRAAGDDVGKYVITAEPTGEYTETAEEGTYIQGNYIVTYKEGTFTINPKGVTLTAKSGGPFTYNAQEYKIEGYDCSEKDVTFEGVTAEGSGTDAGDYEVAFSGATVGETTDTTGNYVVEKLIPGSFTIDPAAVTVTAKDAEKTEGEDDPELTADVEGLIGSDTITYTVTRASGEEPGTYEITPEGEAAQGSYTVTYVPGTFTIKKAGPVPVKTFTITYDLNGGTLDGQTGTVAREYEEGSTITLPAPTRDGYTFDYWEGSRYQAGDSYTVTGDHTFTAQWTEDVVPKYTITYVLNGGKLGSQTGTITTECEDGSIIILPTPARDGYTFDYWQDQAGNRYAAGAKYTVRGPQTFTAQWKENVVPKPDDKKNNPTSAQTKAPGTGDHDRFLFWGEVLCVSMLLLFMTVSHKRRTVRARSRKRRR